MDCSSLSVPRSSVTGLTVDITFENVSTDKVMVIIVLSDGTWQEEQTISKFKDWSTSSHSGAVWFASKDKDDTDRRPVNDQCYVVLSTTSPFTIVIGDATNI